MAETGSILLAIDTTLALTDRAYKALERQKFPRDHIRYLSADPRAQSLYPIDGVANFANLEQAISAWAKGVDQVVIYLVGHGGINSFQLNGGEDLKPMQLKGWLPLMPLRSPLMSLRLPLMPPRSPMTSMGWP